MTATRGAAATDNHRECVLTLGSHQRTVGLSQNHITPRECFVYLNPPFDRYEVGEWIARLAEHGNGITLLHARTEAGWFEPIWQRAAAILFMADRIKFCRPDGSEQPANSGAPPILAAFGDEAVLRLYRCGIGGALVTRWHNQSSSLHRNGGGR